MFDRGLHNYSEYNQNHNVAKCNIQIAKKLQFYDKVRICGKT